MALALALAAPLLAACKKTDANAAAKSRPPPLVVAAKVEARDVPVEVRAPVELKPLAQADVGSKTLGVLDAVLVDRGDHVKRGQLLALVRPSDLPDQLAAARGSLAQAQAGLALARTNAKRAEDLAPSGVVSQQELQQTTSALAAATAAEEAARAQVAALATRLGETRIEAPLEGVISHRRLDPGALVGPSGPPILTVVRIETLRVFITIPENRLEGVQVGRDAHVEIDALKGRSYTGKVVRLAPLVDPATRTLDAEVQIPNPTLELRPGMYGRGAIVTRVNPNAPIVPSSAVQITSGERFVFVVEGEPGAEKVARRRIETGVDEGTWLEVTGGLEAGQEIVIAGIDGLSNGAAVRVARGVDPYAGATTQSAPPPVRTERPPAAPAATP